MSFVYWLLGYDEVVEAEACPRQVQLRHEMIKQIKKSKVKLKPLAVVMPLPTVNQSKKEEMAMAVRRKKMADNNKKDKRRRPRRSY